MFNSTSRSAGRRLLTAGASLAALACAFPALAQDIATTETAPLAAPQPEAQEADTAQDNGEIVVTASRAARDGTNAPTPTVVFGSADLEAKASTTIGDLMTSSPQFQPSTTPTTTQFGGSSFGGSYFNLRGLGIARTLFLVDGRRHVATSNSGTVDSNVVPLALVDRVEIVTGGASAAWGSDAVSGVVNLIFRKNLKGFEASVQNGISEQGDNQTYFGSLAWGNDFAGGRGKVMVAVEGERYEGILHQYNRDWALGEYGVLSNPGYTATNGQNRLVIAPNVQFSVLSENGLITAGPLRGTEFLPGGGTRPFVYGAYAATQQSGGSGVNLAKYTPLALPHDRYSAYGRASYEVTDGLEFFVEGSFAKTHTDVSQMLIPLYQGNLTIRQDNAYLPASIASQLPLGGSFSFGRLNTDFGSAGQSGGAESVRFVGGLTGDLGAGWRVNAYYQFGRSRFDSVEYDDPIIANNLLAIDAVRSPSGQIVCRSTLTNPSNGCVPVNLFGYGAPSQAAIDYITGVSEIVQHITQNVAAADVRGEPFQTWAGPVSFAAGIEYRTEKLETTVDPISAASGFLFGNPKATAGDYNVKEAFAEVIVPLAKGVPFLNSLELNGAIRYTDYSLSGGVTSWKVGVSYAPVEGLRFRGTRSRDIRAANFAELYPTPRNAFSNVIVGNTTYRAQTNVIGNASLAPEQADTTTLGLVFQPVGLRGLRGSVDYYDINIKGAIGTFSAQAQVDLCAGGATNFCALITRDSTGAITAVNTQYINFSSIATRGVDFELGYTLPVPDGQLRIRGLATYVDRLVTTTGPTSIDRAGEAGPNNGGVPHWRGNVSVNYKSGPLSAYAEWRWVGGGTYDNTFGATDLAANRVSGRNYTDLSLTYRIVDTPERRVELFGSVRNLFDRSPPIAPATGINPSQTNAALYDVIGRNFSVGARFKF